MVSGGDPHRQSVVVAAMLRVGTGYGPILGSLGSSTASTAIGRCRGRDGAGAGTRAIADPNASRGHGPGQVALRRRRGSGDAWP